MLCDGVCDSNAIRKAVVGKNVWANISSRSNHGQRFVRSGWLFRQRNLVELHVSRIIYFSGVSNRDDEDAEDHFIAFKLIFDRICVQFSGSRAWFAA